MTNHAFVEKLFSKEKTYPLGLRSIIAKFNKGKLKKLRSVA